MGSGISPLNGRSQGFASLMGITKNNFNVVFIKDWVFHSRVASVSNGSLQNKHQMTFPHPQNWHTINRAIGIILSGTMGVKSQNETKMRFFSIVSLHKGSSYYGTCLLTVSLAPITSVTSVPSKSSLISSISKTMS
mmetsp:Transcript_10564/g.21973  ORF Transcript_10564/g.21973 Transcript_10564/m.21973 type:complete len:136 (+) Transcript_10564:62-469(+)